MEASERWGEEWERRDEGRREGGDAWVIALRAAGGEEGAGPARQRAAAGRQVGCRWRRAGSWPATTRGSRSASLDEAGALPPAQLGP